MAVQQITEYIRQHRNRNRPNTYYTREAIDSQLLDAGYAQGDITAAWDGLRIAKAQRDIPGKAQRQNGEVPDASSSRRWGEHDMPGYKPEKVISSRTFWLVLAGFIVLSYALPAFFLAISPRDACCGSINFGYAWPGLAVAPIMQLAALIWGRKTLPTNRPLAMGLLMGVLLTVVVLPVCAIVALVIIFARIGI